MAESFLDRGRRTVVADGSASIASGDDHQVVVTCERSDGPAPDPARRNRTRDNRELVRMFDLSEDSALVIPSPGRWSVIQGWISRPMGPQSPCRDRAGERPTERVAPLADTLKALKRC